jgi:hypothetical protein
MPPKLPSYTEAQLRSPDGPRLPGLWEPAALNVLDPYALFRDSDWQPVLNLAIVADEITEDGATGLRMLAGSRPETEVTHPNVVSTPTQWITDRKQLEVMLDLHFFDSAACHHSLPERNEPIESLTPTFHLNEINPSRPAVIGKLHPYPQDLGDLTLPLGRMAQKLLAEKLGFESWYDPENRQRLNAAGLHPSLGRISMSRLVAGFSYVGDTADEEPLYEPIVMVGAVLHTQYPKLFPRRTSRYENLTFTPLDTFPQNVRERKVGNLIWVGSERDEVMMCVRGLCLSTSAEMSGGPDITHHAVSGRIGDVYDDAHTAIIERRLARADARGEKMAAKTAAILGTAAFQGERVVFDRAVRRGSNDGKPGVMHTRYEIPEDNEAAIIASYWRRLGLQPPRGAVPRPALR